MKNTYKILLWLSIIAYIVYFSLFSILRYRTLYASYFDLGIMHQTVFNTYKSIQTGDWSRFLELTDPFGSDQIKRMAIHNDILLAPIALLYFIHSGPETLLILQSVVLGLGAWAVFLIAMRVLERKKYHEVLSFVCAFAYLMYTPMQRANIFDFHAVALATSLLLFMYYFWLVEKYALSFLFFLLSIAAKEQISLIALFFGVYVLYLYLRGDRHVERGWRSQNGHLGGEKGLLGGISVNLYFPLLIIGISALWFFISMKLIIPYFRGAGHFALKYYGDFGDSPIGVIIGILTNPYSISKYVFHNDTARYFLFLLGPLAFLPLLSPILLLIALPEFAINLLSDSWNMRNIIFHYTSAIQPFVFIAAIYGVKKITEFLHPRYVIILILGTSLIFSFVKSPLPYSWEKNMHPFFYPQEESSDVAQWSNILQNEQLNIASTGQLAPFFTSRRYYYFFGSDYGLADYVLIRRNEVYNYPEKEELIPVYEALRNDTEFKLIYKKNQLEIYKKISKLEMK